MALISRDTAFTLISSELQVPTVFKHMTDHWPCKEWTLSEWADTLPAKLLFRIGSTSSAGSNPLWEGDSQYVEGSVAEFLEWSKHLECLQENAFSQYNPATSWAYAGYKYMAEVYKQNPDYLKVVDWSNFGFDGRDGGDSTLWIGSKGANTPCHYDTYGYNLVAQLHGKKRWIMFPKDQSSHMQPTRIPFEESSVYSRVNVAAPQLKQFSEFTKTTPYIVCLEAGDVLFVPRHWWHYAECLETSLSINTWIDVEEDSHSRLEEAITKTIISAFITVNQAEEWLNPTEELQDNEFNTTCLFEALKCSVKLSERNHPIHNTAGFSDAMCKQEEASEGMASCDKEDTGRLVGRKRRHSSPQRIRTRLDLPVNHFGQIFPLEPTSFASYLEIIGRNPSDAKCNSSTESAITKHHNDHADLQMESTITSRIEDASGMCSGASAVQVTNDENCAEAIRNLQKLLVNSICHPDIVAQIANKLKLGWSELNSISSCKN